MAAARIILIEDSEPFRDRCKELLEPEFEVVGAFSDASRLLTRVSETQAQIVILDISLPGKGGIQAARELHEYFPEIKFIFLTGEPSSEYVTEALALGASGYVSKIFATEDTAACGESCPRGNKVYLSVVILRPRRRPCRETANQGNDEAKNQAPSIAWSKWKLPRRIERRGVCNLRCATFAAYVLPTRRPNGNFALILLTIPVRVVAPVAVVARFWIM